MIYFKKYILCVLHIIDNKKWNNIVTASIIMVTATRQSTLKPRDIQYAINILYPEYKKILCLTNYIMTHCAEKTRVKIFF